MGQRDRDQGSGREEWNETKERKTSADWEAAKGGRQIRGDLALFRHTQLLKRSSQTGQICVVSWQLRLQSRGFNSSSHHGLCFHPTVQQLKLFLSTGLGTWIMSNSKIFRAQCLCWAYCAAKKKKLTQKELFPSIKVKLLIQTAGRMKTSRMLEAQGHDTWSKHLKGKSSLEFSWHCCFNHIETPCGLVIFVSVYCLLLGGLPIDVLPLPKNNTLYLQVPFGKEEKI